MATALSNDILSLLPEGKALSASQQAKAQSLIRNLDDIQSQISRLLERARQKLPGPKQDRLISQAAQAEQYKIKSEGWNDAINNLAAILFVVNMEKEEAR